ncbi:MAG: hypothetical protein EBU21_09585 [Proteobacteria bacterium]|nr:hypothetical protein [Pseudomonadota bacterium]
MPDGRVHFAVIIWIPPEHRSGPPMDPQTGRTGIAAALFMIITSMMLIPFQDPDSASFVLSVLTLGMGIIFFVILVIMIRRSLG